MEKIYIPYKKIDRNRFPGYNSDYECECGCQILAVCDNPKRALKILEDELKHCNSKNIDKDKCLLFVKIFENINQVYKKEEKILNIFQFKKAIQAIL